MCRWYFVDKFIIDNPKIPFKNQSNFYNIYFYKVRKLFFDVRHSSEPLTSMTKKRDIFANFFNELQQQRKNNSFLKSSLRYTFTSVFIFHQSKTNIVASVHICTCKAVETLYIFLGEAGVYVSIAYNNTVNITACTDYTSKRVSFQYCDVNIYLMSCKLGNTGMKYVWILFFIKKVKRGFSNGKNKRSLNFKLLTSLFHNLQSFVLNHADHLVKITL